MVVWGENCDNAVRFLNPMRRNEMFIGLLRRYEKTNDETEKRTMLRDFAERLLLEDTVSLDEAASICRDADGRKSVSSASVILATLNSAGSRSLRNAVKKTNGKFELAILDEAGQACESEFYIITTFPGVKRVVVVGDPQQLPGKCI
jgi:superfamily I DNA and/or RNA helicase